MPKIEPFEKYSSDYEAWFDRNVWAYRSELKVIEEMLPGQGMGLEIGVGSGQFAKPLGIHIGVDPSPTMAEIARSKGIEVMDGVAESLPFKDRYFDFALMVTTICFVDDPQAALREANRVLKTGGKIFIGFVDRESDLGQKYKLEKSKSRFYKEAVFYSTDEIKELLGKADFTDLQIRQTLFYGLENAHSIEPSKPGYGEGSFVVIRGCK